MTLSDTLMNRAKVHLRSKHIMVAQVPFLDLARYGGEGAEDIVMGWEGGISILRSFSHPSISLASVAPTKTADQEEKGLVSHWLPGTVL